MAKITGTPYADDCTSNTAGLVVCLGGGGISTEALY